MFLTYTTLSGVRCDARNCAIQITGPSTPQWEGMHYYEVLAEAQGWTIWVGRSRQLRCPAHPPRPGGQMRRDTARPPTRFHTEDCPCLTLPDGER